MTTPEHRPVWMPDVRLRQRRDRAYLVRGNEAFSLNDTALFVWKRCDGDHALNQIAVELAEVSGAAAAEVEADCVALVDELVNNSLLRLA